MTWNNRVIHRNIDGVDMYTIHEVFYDENGKMMACTVEPAEAYGETISELLRTLSMYIDACAKPIVEWEDIPEKDARSINLDLSDCEAWDLLSDEALHDFEGGISEI